MAKSPSKKLWGCWVKFSHDSASQLLKALCDFLSTVGFWVCVMHICCSSVSLIFVSLQNKCIDGCMVVCCALPNEDHFTQWKIALTKEKFFPWPQTITYDYTNRYYHPGIRKHIKNFYWDHCQCIKIPYKRIAWLLPHQHIMVQGCLWHYWTMIYKDRMLKRWIRFIGIYWHSNQSRGTCLHWHQIKWCHWLKNQTNMANMTCLITGYAFACFLCILGIKGISTTDKHSQSNVICKSMH